ncbi:MAG: DUF6973 domain-containing protein [Gemmata sp.]
MTSLQSALLLGAGFLVVSGLMELFEGSKGAAQANTALTLAAGFKKPQSGGGNSVAGGRKPGGAGRADSSGPAKLPNGADITPEPPGTKFWVPGYGQLTDEEIGAAQKRLDQWRYPPTSIATTAVGGFFNMIYGDEEDGEEEAGLISRILALKEGGAKGVIWNSIRDQAESFAERYSREPGEWNALQHSYWQALLAFDYGSVLAQEFGDQHEKLQQYGNAQRRRDSAADLFNNQVGRAIGRQVRDEADRSTDPGFDPSRRMMELVAEAIRDGRLDLGGGVGGAGVRNPHGRDGLRRELKIEPRALQVPNPFWKG